MKMLVVISLFAGLSVCVNNKNITISTELESNIPNLNIPVYSEDWE